jgi:hypothetical protein
MVTVCSILSVWEEVGRLLVLKLRLEDNSALQVRALLIGGED